MSLGPNLHFAFLVFWLVITENEYTYFLLLLEYAYLPVKVHELCCIDNLLHLLWN